MIITPTYAFSSAKVPTALLGESPAVDQQAGQVWWVDTSGRRLFRTDLDGGESKFWTMPEEPGFVVLDQAGQPIIGMETGLFAFDPNKATLATLLNQTRLGHRFNDATVDDRGTLWVSTMPLDLAKGAAALWRVAADLALKPVIQDLCIPNGMTVDTGRSRLFYSDSHWDIQTIWTAPINPDTGDAGEPVFFADMKNKAGRPDGAALDAAGRYWIAAVDGAALYVYAPEGQFLFEVPLPVQSPTKPAFFGPRLEKLAVTSKSDGAKGGRLTFVSFAQDIVQGLQQPRWKRPQNP
ncbi:MAG: SMP-30/gluconolactonase/LRE family protein [Rhizobiaceae bacterium]|nr:SMP-30/gluconolactonase/LRE family protein [Rhizobiaceae bacterium]